MAEWIIPCNPRYYDVDGAFREYERIDWKQSTSVQEGDFIYIYVCKPIQAIKYICIATKVNLDKQEIDDSRFVIDGTNYENYGRYMELKCIYKPNHELMGLAYLEKRGLKRVQGPMHLPSGVSIYINELIEQEDVNKDSGTNKLESVVEGSKKQYFTTKYERSLKNRLAAIELHGTKCMVCGFDFERMYGQLGKKFIEVHHVKPLYSLEEKIEINPKTDLVCLCSNCHSMIHRSHDSIVSVEELKSIIRFSF